MRNTYPQAAAAPWRKAGTRLEILLITPRDAPRCGHLRWILPQGGVEPGQTAREAAIAEAWEEAGVRGVASQEAFAHYEYESGTGRCRVHVFALEVRVVEGDWPERNDRRRLWLPYEEALRAISGKTLQDALKRFPRKRIL